MSSFVNRIGTGMFLATSALYFTVIVGIPARQVGTGLSIAGLAALLGSVPAGTLADRVGPRTVQVVTLAVQTVTMALFVVVHSWWAFTVVAALDYVADAANNAARGALIGRIGGERPALFRAKLRTFVSVGVVAGTLLAAVAIQIGTRGAYVTVILVNAASYVVCALLLLRVPSFGPLPKPEGTRRFAALADRPYAAFAALNGLINLQAVVVTLLIPLWIASRTHIPHWAAAAVFGLNFVVGTALMQPVGRRIETTEQGGKALRIAGLAIAAGCAVLAGSGSGPRWSETVVLFGGAAVLCAAGVWVTAAGFSLSFGLAPAHAQGQYQGRDIARPRRRGRGRTGAADRFGPRSRRAGMGGARRGIRRRRIAGADGDAVGRADTPRGCRHRRRRAGTGLAAPGTSPTASARAAPPSTAASSAP